MISFSVQGRRGRILRLPWRRRLLSVRSGLVCLDEPRLWGSGGSKEKKKGSCRPARQAPPDGSLQRDTMDPFSQAPQAPVLMDSGCPNSDSTTLQSFLTCSCTDAFKHLSSCRLVHVVVRAFVDNSILSYPVAGRFSFLRHYRTCPSLGRDPPRSTNGPDLLKTADPGSATWAHAPSRRSYCFQTPDGEQSTAGSPHHQAGLFSLPGTAEQLGWTGHAASATMRGLSKWRRYETGRSTEAPTLFSP